MYHRLQIEGREVIQSEAVFASQQEATYSQHLILFHLPLYVDIFVFGFQEIIVPYRNLKSFFT